MNSFNYLAPDDLKNTENTATTERNAVLNHTAIEESMSVMTTTCVVGGVRMVVANLLQESSDEKADTSDSESSTSTGSNDNNAAAMTRSRGANSQDTTQAYHVAVGETRGDTPLPTTSVVHRRLRSVGTPVIGAQLGSAELKEAMGNRVVQVNARF